MSHRPFIPWVWYSSCSWTLTGHPWTENQIHTQGEIIVAGGPVGAQTLLMRRGCRPQGCYLNLKRVVIKEVALLSSAVGNCHPALPLGGLPGWAEWASTVGKQFQFCSFRNVSGAAALRWHFPPSLLWREPGPTWMGVLYAACGWARAPW